MQANTVSIIIPVLNQVKKLHSCLHALEKQINNNPVIEVIVVDNGSTDGSEDLAEKYGFKQLNYLEGNNPYKARNFGVDNTQANVIAFLDAKCTPGENYISEILSLKDRNDWDIIAGDFDFIGLNNNSSLSELAYAVIHLRTNPKYNGGEVSSLTGNMLVVREQFIRLGKFDENRSGGDVRFSQKAQKEGFRKVYIPELRASYSPKKYDDLILSIKRDSKDLPNPVSISSVRPAGKNYLNSRLDDLNINIGGFKRLRLQFFIMYLRFLKYYYQNK